MNSGVNKSADIAFIEKLNSRTTFALDGLLSAEEFADCFTSEGHLIVEKADGTIMEDAKGRDGLIKVCQHIASPEGARHFSLNVMVDIDGDNAVLRAYGMVISIKVQPRAILRTTLQTDTLTRDAQGWRISKRVLTIDSGGALT